MALFPDVNHKVYRNSFLNSVSVCMVYPELNSDSASLRDRSHSFYQDNFGVQSSKDFLENEVVFSNSEFGIEYSFSAQNCCLQVSTRKYNGFEVTLLGLLYRVKNFFKDVLNVASAKSVCVRKVSVFPIKVEEEYSEDLKKQFFEYIFSSDFLKCDHGKQLTYGDEMTEEFLVTHFEDLENCFYYTIKHGILHDHTDEKKHRVVLDINVECKNNNTGILIDEVEKTLVRINQSIYNAFHYCVTPAIIKLMEEESEDKL